MEDGRRSDGDGGQVDEVYLCPICNTRVNSTQTECPGCGAIFVDDEDAVTFAGDHPEEGMDEAVPATPLEYRCPACGGSVTEEDETCPHCGALFIDDSEATAPPTAPTPPPVAPAIPPAKPTKKAAKAAAKAKEPPEAEPPEERKGSQLEGLSLSSLTSKGSKETAATHRRQSYAARHSLAVVRLSKRRKIIAQRRMLGLALLAAGFAIYIGSLMVYRPEGLTIASALILAVSITVLLLGALILYNQHHAWQHYQAQLQTARIEATLLRERSEGKKEKPTPPPARAKSPKKVAPQRVQPTDVVVDTEPVRVTPQKRVVTGAAAAAAANVQMPAASGEPRRVELPTGSAADPDKVACPNCGYLNRSIFVRCIRCGTELTVVDESIPVETFERPEEPDPSESPRPRGGPVPWEARQISSQGGRAAARQAARQAARGDEGEDAPATEDRRAAIGVAANFTKLPKNMREELIRTLYKVSDPVVRQDTVSAIAEHYTELPKDIQDLLIDLTDDEDPRVREEVAFEVNRNFDRIPLNVIQIIFSKLAHDPENLVREDVVSAIAENFQRLPKETQDLLKDLAADQKESVRDEVSFEVAKNSDVIPEKFKSEIKEILRQASS